MWLRASSLLWLAAGVLLAACSESRVESPWTPQQAAQLRSLALDRLAGPPADPSNRFAADPRAARFGERLFFDPRLSRNGQVSCASCHQPVQHFSDGLRRSRGIATAARHAPGLEASAHARWLFWDGRADSLWAQALGPLEDPREQGLGRVQLAQIIARHYREDYERVFGALPALEDPRRFAHNAGPRAEDAGRRAWARMASADRDAVTRVAVNVGKAIAAYERGLRPSASRFDVYLQQLEQGQAPVALTAAEVRGLKLFIGEGQCLRCHSGPLLSNHAFHNTGLASQLDASPDAGRAQGLRSALADELNCAGPYSDTPAAACPHLTYARPGAPEWLGAFKVPSLRNVARTAPYMHDGRFETLAQVVEHYDRAPNPDGLHGHTELQPLGLDAREKRDLLAFLGTLSSMSAGDVGAAHGRDRRSTYRPAFAALGRSHERRED